ncbi:type VI secretion system Vgr family protein [Legionella spiritensis]|uniref:Gp5/Type VI secretion system Vgr protein OB-fold domain-containing protein n=1 Tax=Legionella spiritensis TaxID=452 RepID=A0A0W0Z9E7_LEGSP|nr:type VI secretion system tip protein TssI/VgrG [Legionella spiritensis]KTD65733.1 hypothetical protein Lspi_0445 [Legionella spiritensis]SNV43058.1 Uncharacterized protein conserved in bacteria [Legionella spiritensis]
MKTHPKLLPELQITALDTKNITVLAFEGTMGMSMLYQFDVEFATRQPIDLSLLLYSRATLQFRTKNGKKTPVHGVIIECRQSDGIGDYFIYSLRLAPGVYGLTLTQDTNISLDKSIPNIIEAFFIKNAIRNYKFDLIRQYPPREFVFQYNEKDWFFITRWMQMEGLFYYFNQTKTEEQLVITDSNQTLLNNKDTQIIYYQAYPDDAEAQGATSDLAYNFKQSVTHLPQRVIVNAYNHKQSSKPYTSQAMVSPKGFGERKIWAEHIESMAENQEFANRVAESLQCQSNLVDIETSASLMNPGTLIQHRRFKNNSLNTPHIIIKSVYAGSQKKSFLSQNAHQSRADEDFFSCRYSAIAQTVTYRDEINAKIPRIHGVLPGFIDHEGSENTVQIDKEGLYKFKIAIGKDPDGKGSHWVRKMESYIGDKYALNIPIHKSMEAVVAFHFGNPDLPILLGTVSNSTHRNVIINETQNYMGLQTINENSFFINEEKGKQQGIQLYTPNNKTMLTLGTDNIFSSKLDAGYYMGTTSSAFMNIQIDFNRDVGGNSTFNCHMNSSYYVGENRTTHIVMDDMLSVEGNSFYNIGGNSIGMVGGNDVITVEGNKKTTVKGFTIYANQGGWSVYNYWGIKYHGVVGLEFISTLGGKIVTSGPFNINITNGWKYEDDTTVSVNTSAVKVIEAASITLKTGPTQITLDPAGISIVTPEMDINSATMLTLTSPLTNIMGVLNAFGEISAGLVVNLGAAPTLMSVPPASALSLSNVASDQAAATGVLGSIKGAAGSVTGAAGKVASTMVGGFAMGVAASAPGILSDSSGDVGPSINLTPQSAASTGATTAASAAAGEIAASEVAAPSTAATSATAAGGLASEGGAAAEASGLAETAGGSVVGSGEPAGESPASSETTTPAAPEQKTDLKGKE